MTTILGIRHHGVGSAQQVLARLGQLQPDLLLVEGPPEADPMTGWIGQERLKPPAAILCYDAAQPQRAAFYPFSEFSPEWQAMCYANRHNIPVRLMDLPIALRWEMDDQVQNQTQVQIQGDPIGHFAAIAGYGDADLWWEHQFEHHASQTEPEEHFEAVLLMMRSLRESQDGQPADPENELREAWMARMLRQAQNELYQNIVVVCGAWHAPALLDLDRTEKAHQKVLKQLPGKTKIKVGVTWVPWTNDRLAYNSGYGAGIKSPGWYQHLWSHPADMGQRWLSRVAQLFRQKNMDISTAHVIEACRLAESLAGLRDLTRPGLHEMNEATATVMCMGDTILLDLVWRELIVGNALGKVPDSLPKLPLQADFEEQARRLRLPQTAEAKELTLDLRKPLDLARSVFFYRLIILGISWAKLDGQRGKGTWREQWTLEWQPEMLITLIERGIWGNTLELAASQYLLSHAAKMTAIGELSGLTAQAIPAELYDAIGAILQKIHAAAAVSADIAELMQALLPLADLGRYGNVRNSDLEAVHQLLDGLTIRICIGLPNACYGLNEEAAQQMFDLIRRVNDAIRTLENETLTEEWFKALTTIAGKNGVPALLEGCTCRLLFDAQVFDRTEMARRFSYALSAGQDPADSAGWLEGFLKGSGMILLYDDLLWNLVHQWLAEIQPAVFTQLLPILRRTFAKYSTGERRSLGERARQGTVRGDQAASPDSDRILFDEALGEQALELAARFLLDQPNFSTHTPAN